MLKLIFKNIWAHRRRNLWILIELILISLAAWFVIEPLVVFKYTVSRYPGYDIDRLVHIELAAKPTEDKYSREERYDDVNRILTKLRSDPQVESATIAPSQCFENNNLSVSSLPDDSINGTYVEVEFVPGTDFFKTFGITADNGKMFNEPECNKNDIIVSRSVAEILHPGVNPVDHYLNEHSKMDHGRNKRIVGVVDDALYRSTLSRTAIIYKALTQKDVNKRVRNFAIVARMKPGVSPADFVREHAESINTELSSGPLYAHSPQTYIEMRNGMAANELNEIAIFTALVVFLVVNLCLGIIGTFYLQTRDRSRDAGIMRAFGATRRSICRNLIAEGWLMAVVSWCIGNVGVWLIVRNFGFTQPDSIFDLHCEAICKAIPLWIDDFATHFWAISGIVLLLLLITVTIGVYIPARRIADISPVDALRENN